MTLFEELKWRGLIKDVAGEGIEEQLNNKKITFYWGTDPTAESLHLGHYSSLITAKRLMLAGHNPILLVGGATGRIGDPRPTAEREIIDIEVLNKNIEGIREQINKIFDGKAKLVNNYDWFQGYEFLDFLRDVGKYINVNYMISKDIISRRLETGITYAEFSYMLIQGYDFLHMYDKYGCTMQVEGSDQWGNITTGLDLIRKIKGEEAYAFTMPLILDANGKKFGKSEGNALWLDKEKTSSYSLYQYLINTDDSMVESYLKVFTFLTPEEIMDVVEKHNKEPHLRIGQKELARCIITDLHGEAEYEKAVKLTENLFSNKFKELSKEDVIELFGNQEIINVQSNVNVVDFITDMGVVKSKREAREFIGNGAISINGDKIENVEMIVDDDMFIDNTYIVVKKGKKNYFIGKK